MTETAQDNLVARLMQHVEDTMCDADVDFPAGHEAGPRVSYDSDFLQTCFEFELTAALAREAALRTALEWYEEQARLCRLIHSGGDPARKALNDDGGAQARAALEVKQ